MEPQEKKPARIRRVLINLQQPGKKGYTPMDFPSNATVSDVWRLELCKVPLNGKAIASEEDMDVPVIYLCTCYSIGVLCISVWFELHIRSYEFLYKLCVLFIVGISGAHTYGY